MAKTFRSDLLERPRFRAGVDISADDDKLTLAYRGQAFDVGLSDGVGADTKLLFEALRRGDSTVPQLAAASPSLGSQVADIVRDLDKMGLLTETRFERTVPAAQELTGRQFYPRLVGLADRAKRREATSRFYTALKDLTITRKQLIGYVLEYYHIVHMCPTILAPALAFTESKTSRDILQRFYVSEWRHDRMVIESLAAVGISEAQLDATIALPTTYALCAGLAAYARQHPLSLKASLFLFEATDDSFNEAFVGASEALGLPSGFWKPIIAHAQLNDDGRHDDISAELYADVPFVSPEDQTVVQKHLVVLVETLARQERDIMAYYGDPDSLSPRCY